MAPPAGGTKVYNLAWEHWACSGPALGLRGAGASGSSREPGSAPAQHRLFPSPCVGFSYLNNSYGHLETGLSLDLNRVSFEMKCQNKTTHRTTLAKTNEQLKRGEIVKYKPAAPVSVGNPRKWSPMQNNNRAGMNYCPTKTWLTNKDET